MIQSKLLFLNYVAVSDLNFALAVNVSRTPTSVAEVLDTSDIMQFIVHLKLSSILQLTKGKKGDQKLFKYFNGTTISVSDTLLLVMCSPLFCLILKQFTGYKY